MVKTEKSKIEKFRKPMKVYPNPEVNWGKRDTVENLIKRAIFNLRLAAKNLEESFTESPGALSSTLWVAEGDVIDGLKEIREAMEKRKLNAKRKAAHRKAN